jgi:putative Holliday junction resolvase
LRLLGIDYGFKRIGLAVAEAEFGIITPKSPLAASGTLRIDSENLAVIAKKEVADKIVLGLPIEEDGNPGKMARVCQTVAEHLRERGYTVDLIDERYSSVEAEAALRQEDLKASQRRKLRDGEAARILLERYLENLEKA